MNEPLPETGERRLQAYLARLAEVVGHADRRERVVGYCTGLLLPGERKSVEPMAARLDPGRVGAAHQSLHHFVAKAAWDDAALLGAVRDHALPALLERDRGLGPEHDFLRHPRLGPAGRRSGPPGQSTGR